MRTRRLAVRTAFDMVISLLASREYAGPARNWDVARSDSGDAGADRGQTVFTDGAVSINIEGTITVGTLGNHWDGVVLMPTTTRIALPD